MILHGTLLASGAGLTSSVLDPAKHPDPNYWPNPTQSKLTAPTVPRGRTTPGAQQPRPMRFPRGELVLVVCPLPFCWAIAEALSLLPPRPPDEIPGSLTARASSSPHHCRGRAQARAGVPSGGEGL